jgi:Xaa-Pro aminopeptidase
MVTHADTEERNRRFTRLRQAMEREQLDALVVAGKGHWWTGRGYFRYLTDFHLWGHDGLILLPREETPALTLTSAAVAGMIGERGWITEVYGDPDIAPQIVAAAQAKGLARGRIGVVGQRFIIAQGTYQLLTDGLPDATFVNADRVFDRVRAVKSPLEIEQNRELWELARRAMARYVEALEPGRTQWEVSAEAIQVFAAGGGRDFLVFFNGRPPQNVPVALDDVLSYHMEVCGPSGHWCELTTTCAFREPTEREHRLMETELRALDEICRQATPGTRLSELSQTFERVLREDGWTLSEHQAPHYDFHSQGMDVIEWPNYGPLDTRQDTPVEEGMIFSYHPSRHVLPEVRSTGFNEDILITADGAEPVCPAWDMRWRVME